MRKVLMAKLSILVLAWVATGAAMACNPMSCIDSGCCELDLIPLPCQPLCAYHQRERPDPDQVSDQFFLPNASDAFGDHRLRVLLGAAPGQLDHRVNHVAAGCAKAGDSR